MTPREKAKELYDKFYQESPLKSSCIEKVDRYDVIIQKDSMIAKKCALICVDEILEVCKRQLLNNIEKPFWLEVKEEINKL